MPERKDNSNPEKADLFDVWDRLAQVYASQPTNYPWPDERVEKG